MEMCPARDALRRYDYSAGRMPVDDPEVEALIKQHSAEMGIARA